MQTPGETESSCTGGPKLPTVKNYEAVGALVRKRRDAAGLSIEEAAAAFAVALRLPRAAAQCCRGTDYLLGLERGLIAPHPEHLAALERVLDLPTGELHHAYGYLASDEVPPLGEDYVTLTEAAHLLGVSKGSVHHAITRGKLQACRLMPPVGRASLILVVRRADLESYEPRSYPRRSTTSSL